jgi:hypothetical protein
MPNTLLSSLFRDITISERKSEPGKLNTKHRFPVLKTRLTRPTPLTRTVSAVIVSEIVVTGTAVAVLCGVAVSLSRFFNGCMARTLN